MNIKPYDKTIKDLFLSQKQFIIPRFQREYSWDKKNYVEFFEDMVKALEIVDGKITSSQYFLGTMLFVGNFTEGTEKEIVVVDGQQRLTTITILFSAMSFIFKSINQEVLSEQLFRYIMTINDNGEEVRILKSKSHYPYFAYFIQDKTKSVATIPTSEEEERIKETYEYFMGVLQEKKLKKLLSRYIGNDYVVSLPFVEILKALRDQILNTTFVSISTDDSKQANSIFEILNAKGKSLAHIDLIKNKIFETLTDVEPADFAEEQWKKIKTTLRGDNNEAVGLATFYSHYWNSKYKKSTANKLYDDFLKQKLFTSKDKCRDFLNDMALNASYYMKIVNPNRSDYDNRKEYFWLVQSLNAMSNLFNIVQVRIALIALYDIKERELISTKLFKKTVQYLENFHFAYNAVTSGRANKVEKIYSVFSISVRKSTSKEETEKIIQEKLINELELFYPSWNSFSQDFIKLSYSKKEHPSNVKTKYAINKLCCYFMGNEIFPDNGSIEHILPESSDANFDVCKIGNLILLEEPLNKEADTLSFEDKINVYRKSCYPWVKSFIEMTSSFSQSDFQERALRLSKLYYEKILNRRIEEDRP